MRIQTRWSLAPAILLCSLSCSSKLAAENPGTLLVIEKGQASLALIDPATGHETISVSEEVKKAGDTGHEVATSSDGKYAFVPIYGNSGVGKPGTDGHSLVAIDIATHAIVGTLDFGYGARPHCAVLNSRDGYLYVTTEMDKSVTVVDVKNPKAMRIVGTAPTGSTQSHMLAISHDGLWGYTANVGPGTVSVMDLKNKKVVTLIPVTTAPVETQRISISADDRWVFTSDQTKPRLAVIDTKSHSIAKWIEMPGTGYGSAPTPDGRWLLVAMPTVKKVAVIDLKTMAVAQSIDVSATPQEVLVAPDGKHAYVSCDRSNEVAEIDTSNWTVVRNIATGKGPDGLAWAK
jgi:YVTN family beta-propeller protein